MSRIDDLIAEYCPNGVEFTALGEIGEFIRGNGLQKTELFDEGVPAIHYGQIHTHYGIWTERTKSFTSPEKAAKLRRAHPGDLIIATTSEDDEAVAKATAWLGDEEVAVSGDAYIFRHSLDPRFVAYFFHSERFQEQKRPFITGTKVRRVSGGSLAKVRIPVPPLEVQREIVRILDQFTQLEAELEAELEARRQQYAHYRCELLCSGEVESARWVPLGEIAELRYGLTARGQDSGDYRFLRITDISPWGTLLPDGAKYVAASSSSNEYLVQAGDLLMARTGATYGKTLLVRSEEPATYASYLIRIRLDPSRMSPDFYWHFSQSGHYWEQVNAMVSTGGQPQFNANVLKLVKVPTPDLVKQERIVAILDEFDALANDLSVGLPAELAARRKQYEYYRDKLLTFKEAK
ncbi:type I restriction enzyme, S subunit [Ruaniaceae bacterium KH17]|nr:type I restriction enzyme, S subunit [Ruaniaceae bacterium KH17]